MDDKKPKQSVCTVASSLAAKKESQRAIPNTAAGHKNPDMKPIGDKAMSGAKLN